jgi:hypothetical protein
MAEKIPDTIPQIGPATLAILRQEGIETNLDVLYHRFPYTTRPFGDTDSFLALKSVPGIGPGREALLREWAKRVPLTTGEKTQIEQEKERQNQELERRRAERAYREAEEYAMQIAEEHLQRVRSEDAAKRRLAFTQKVMRGTIAGWVCWFTYLILNDNGFFFSIITTGFWSAVLGWIVKYVGDSYLPTPD